MGEFALQPFLPCTRVCPVFNEETGLTILTRFFLVYLFVGVFEEGTAYAVLGAPRSVVCGV